MNARRQSRDPRRRTSVRRLALGKVTPLLEIAAYPVEFGLYLVDIFSRGTVREQGQSIRSRLRVAVCKNSGQELSVSVGVAIHFGEWFSATHLFNSSRAAGLCAARWLKQTLVASMDILMLCRVFGYRVSSFSPLWRR